MFVSILQMIGIPFGKPVHSPADANPRGKRSKVDSEGSNDGLITQTDSARRLEVKAKTGKVKGAAKAVKATKSVKVAAVAKPAKVTQAVKAVKVAHSVKPTKPIKLVAQAKSTPKAIVKPQAKSLEKHKPAVKTNAKPAAPKATSAKPAVKPAAVVKERKSSVKAASKVSKSAVSKIQEPAIKPKVKTKDPVNKTTIEARKPETAAAKAKPLPTAVAVKPAAVPVPASAASAPLPARAGRPSSRLAQLTVPSMAQSVASTAAKASFSQTMTSPLIVPPLASTVKKDLKLANNWKSKSVDQLTDAELIAMPDDEYMNEVQMEFFRRRLIRLKRDILSNAGETTEHLREDTVVVPDPADRATIEEEHALELRTRDRERKLLKKIEQSIARIEAGDYGYCDETGEPIGVGRLLARPTASLSLEAQQRRELKQKMFGD